MYFFINSITPIKNELVYNNRYRFLKEDDSDFMFVCDLERNGQGTYSDGFSGRNVPIAFTGNMINGTNNPHYYSYDPLSHLRNGDSEQNKYPLKTLNTVNVFAVGDAYWKFDTNGGRFIKDSEVVNLIAEREASLEAKYAQEKADNERKIDLGMDPNMMSQETIQKMIADAAKGTK